MVASQGPPKKTPWIPIAVAVVVVAAAGGVGTFFLLQPRGEGPAIVLGAPLATGFLYGIGAQRGLQMAVDEINAAGGVKVGNETLPFRLIVTDTRDLEPGVLVEDALRVVENLITARGADVIIGGPVRSEAAIAAMDMVSDHRTLHLLTTGALSPVIHSRIGGADHEKYKFTFRITSEAARLAAEAQDILTHIRTNHGYNKVYIMVQQVAHAEAIGGLLKSRLEAAGGWQVWPTQGPAIYPTGSTDYSVSLQEAKDVGAQILFVWMDHPETSILMRQWKDSQIPALPVSGINSAMEVPTAWAETNGAIEYVIASPVNTGNAPSAYGPAKDFLAAYEAKYEGREPEGYGVVSSYTAVYVLKAAIERAGSLDVDALITALEATDYMGPYGRVRFNATNHQIIPSYDPSVGAVNCWFQWLAGERKQVWPASQTFAMSEILIPPWLPPVTTPP